MKTFTIELDDLLAERIERLAGFERRRVEDLIVLLVDQHVFGNVGRNYKPPTAAEVAQFIAERGRQKRITLTAKQRNAIYERCEGKCAYCKGTILFDEVFHIDHIKPVAKGGGNEDSNLTLSCVACNVRKHTKEVVPA